MEIDVLKMSFLDFLMVDEFFFLWNVVDNATWVKLYTD